MARVLVIQLGRLGDVIQTTPLVRELLHGNPGDSVDILVFDSLKQIVEGIGLGKIHALSEGSLPLTLRQLDRSIEQNRKHQGPVPYEAQEALRNLALPIYDRIMNCTYSPIGAFIAQNARSKSVTGPVITPAGEVLFHHPAHIYLRARAHFRNQNWFNLVDVWRASGHPYGDNLYKNNESPFLGRSHVPVASELPFEIPPGRIVALNPGSSDAVRRWPPADFAFLAEGLISHGFVPALVGAPADRQTCAEVQARCSSKIANFCGKTSVSELALFLTRSDLLVSNDTGAIHIAAAAGRRSLSLFGSTAYFAETAPWDGGHVILQGPLGSDIILLQPKLVLATALYCLGMIGRSELQLEIARQNASAWETFYLEPDADPLGGISYQPLHQNDFSPEQVFTRELRHLFAQIFCEGEEFLSAEYSSSGISQPASRSSKRRASDPGDEIARFINLLESMAEAAGRCRTLCPRATRQSAAEIASLTASLVTAIEELKTHSESRNRLKPAIHFLDWTCRMMEPMEPAPTFHAHELAYQLTARMLREGEWRAESKPENHALLVHC